MVNFTHFVLQKYPGVRTTLRIAHSSKSPEAFVKNALRLSIYGSFALTVLAFFVLSRSASIIALPFLLAGVFVFSFLGLLVFVLNSPKSAIRKREREVENDVLFAGRYLLVKIESGTPLVNTLDDASRSSGASSKSFGEIMNDVNTGVPLEQALDNAVKYSASDKFKRIIWEISTTLKTGSEIRGVLSQTLKSIASEQSLEIKKYGKKLNSMVLFYMIIGCVAPSLGVTMLIIISGFLSLDLTPIILYTILFFVGIVQFAFIVMLRAVRPTVNL